MARLIGKISKKAHSIYQINKKVQGLGFKPRQLVIRFLKLHQHLDKVSMSPHHLALLNGGQWESELLKVKMMSSQVLTTTMSTP